MRRLWAGDRVTHRSDAWVVDDVKIEAVPGQRRRIPIWFGSTNGSTAPARRAARYDGYPQLIVAAGGRPEPEMTAAWERDHPLGHREWSVSEHAYRAWQRARLGAFASACGLRDDALQRFLDRIDKWRYPGLFDVFPDVRPALTALKARGLTVAVCSNWDWCLDRHLVHNGIDDLCDAVVCSAMVGVRKPHPEIFDLVLDRTGSAPGETLFVGDSWRDDVAGARTAGLTPVHIVRTGACRTADHDGVACVTGLDQVVRLCG